MPSFPIVTAFGTRYDLPVHLIQVEIDRRAKKEINKASQLKLKAELLLKRAQQLAKDANTTKDEAALAAAEALDAAEAAKVAEENQKTAQAVAATDVANGVPAPASEPEAQAEPPKEASAASPVAVTTFTPPKGDSMVDKLDSTR
jgi:nucleoid-associated protein YgaU